jgi:hypothetical protein
MPKVTIKFEQDKDEDLGSLMAIVKGPDLFAAIYETAQAFRNIIKHDQNITEEERNGVILAQRFLIGNIEAAGIDTDFYFYRNYEE